jgi:energy-coupling factor transport system permease protein
MAIEYVDGNSPIHRLNPITKVFFSLYIIGATLSIRDIFSLILVLLGIMGLWAIAGIPGLLSRFKFLFVIMAATGSIWIVAQAFLWNFGGPGIKLFRFDLPMWPTPIGAVYLSGLTYGLAMVIRIIAIFSCVPLLTLTTSIPKIVVALQKLRVPYKFNFALSTAVRFSPLIFTTFYDIKDAQVLRAHDVDKMGYVDKIRKAFVPIVTPLFMSLLRRSDDLEIAIESRAFGAPVKRTFVEEFRFTYLDYIFFAGMILFTVLIVVGQIYWKGYIVPSDWMAWVPIWARPPVFLKIPAVDIFTGAPLWG